MLESPYSEKATLAELKIADIHFERESYEEAASYYQDFVELHPNHAEAAPRICSNEHRPLRKIA